MHKQLKVCREVLALLLMVKDLAESFLSTRVEKSPPDVSAKYKGRGQRLLLISRELQGLRRVVEDVTDKWVISLPTASERSSGRDWQGQCCDRYRLRCGNLAISGEAGDASAQPIPEAVRERHDQGALGWFGMTKLEATRCRMAARRLWNLAGRSMGLWKSCGTSKRRLNSGATGRNFCGLTPAGRSPSTDALGGVLRLSFPSRRSSRFWKYQSRRSFGFLPNSCS